MKSLKLSLIIFGCTALLLASHSPTWAQFDQRDPAVVEAYEEGLRHMEAERWDEAFTAFSTAVSADDLFAEAHVGRGDALRQLEDYAGARTSYGRALQMNPDLARAYLGRGISNLELGQIDIAYTDLNTAIELDRRDPEIAAKYGNLLVNIVQDPVGGIRALDRAIELDPTNAEAYRDRGWGHTMMRQFDDAQADLQRAIELEPENFEFHSTLANVLLFQEKFKEALVPLSSAIQFYEPERSSDPSKYLSGYLMLAEAHLRLAQEEDATEEEQEEHYQKALSNTEAILDDYPDTFPQSGQAMHRKGLALRMQGRYGEAIKAFTDAIQLIPPGESAAYVADALRKRGICWHLQGEDRLARGDFELAAAVNYEDPLPHLWIGFTHAQEEDYRAAIESYGRAIARQPDFSRAYINRGLAYIKLNEYQRAVDNFNDAIRHEPSEARHFYKRGIAYMEMEEFERAHNSFEHAMLNDDTYAAAFRKAAQTARELGRDNVAAELESRARELEAITD